MKQMMIGMAALVAVGAQADATTGRIRHMADTYLQSDGTQIIDTGYIASTNMRVEVVFTPLERQYSTYTRYVWGSNASSTPASLRCSTYVQCNNAANMNGAAMFISGASTNTTWQGGSSPSTRSRYKAVLDYRNRAIEMWSGETRVYTATPNNPGFETDNCSLVIFGARQRETATPTPSFIGRVYSFVVYDKGVLVRDMIPYGRGAVTGLLDRCSGKVYVKTRGNAFVLGTEDGYIRSDRTQRSGQYVDTGYCVNPQTKIEVDFAFMDITTAQRLFGADTVDGHGLGFYINGSTKFAWYCRDNPKPGWVGDSTGINPDSARRKVTIDIPNREVTLATEAGEEYKATITNECELTSTTTLRLFGNCTTNATGAAVLCNQASVKIFSAKIWDGETLVRNYVPRIVDNEEGLYDMVNDTLKSADLSGNSSTGKFRLTAGGDIECAASVGTVAANADAYLQGRKSQGIQTDYYTSRKSRLEIDFGISAYEGTEYFFGAVDTTLGNTNNVGMYYQKGSTGARNIQFRYWKGTTTDWPNVGENSASPVRYKAVMDLAEAKGYLYKTGVLKKTTTLNLPSGNFQNTAPLRIMSTQSDNGNCGYGRLYSFAVYEDNVLVHRYVPCVENGIAGVRDSVDKRFFGNYKTTDGSGFTIHGAGVDGGGMVFTEQPQGGRLSRGHTLTLTAFAPGAAGYQWLKNGAIVEGATGRTLEVAYGEGGTTDVYQCVSYYDLFGYGVSSEAQVENLPSGTVVIFR